MSNSTKDPVTAKDPAVEAKLRAELSTHEAAAIHFITAAKAAGDCCVVTNAEMGWVEQSCSKFLPNLVPHLKTVPIFSARHFFEQKCPENPMIWKVQHFLLCDLISIVFIFCSFFS